MIKFVAFPDIEGFHNAVKAVNVFPELAGSGQVNYRGKNKLHGTNAGVRIKDGEVAAQSRSQMISVQSDNEGFARWVEANKEYFASISLANATIFGEWCGPGIQKGKAAISQLANKIFAVFAIVIGERPEDPDLLDVSSEMINEPTEIEKILGNRPKDVYVLPWYGDIVPVDFTNRDKLLAVADSLNKVVETVESCDPWVKDNFGIEGIGEGVVYYPYADEAVIKVKQFADLAFKAKGEEHKVVKTKQAVQVDPEVAASVDEFVTMFVTEARCQQGVTTTGGVIETKNTGKFLAWLVNDVKKESEAELEASKLTWDQVQKQVQTAARQWYINKAKTI